MTPRELEMQKIMDAMVSNIYDDETHMKLVRLQFLKGCVSDEDIKQILDERMKEMVN
jgi:hypothetical protein